MTECAAVTTDGWIKNGTAQRVNGAKCDLWQKVFITNELPLWPMPASVTNGTTSLVMDPASFKFVAVTPSSELDAAFARVLPLIFDHPAPSSSAAQRAQAVRAKLGGHAPAAGATAAGIALPSVQVTVKNLNAPLQLGRDESYQLTIPSDGTAATLTANTVYGAYHGLQTFSQLVHWDAVAQQYYLQGAPLAVVDQPYFPWRGLMIDTSRHFLPRTALYSVLDSMSYAKYNVLHWHIVDWQAWPLESVRLPLLWESSWSPAERYTFDDVAAVLEYATSLGIQLVVEFDTPGHAGGMCQGYPDLCPAPDCNMPLNPASNNTLPAIQAVLQELAALLPSTYMHLGGDEVDTACWTNSAEITSWMNARNLSADGTYEYFVTQTDAMALAMGRLPVRWEEVWQHFGQKLDPRTIIHAWLSDQSVIDATDHGYQTIFSLNGVYYLPHLGTTWQTFYDTDPLRGVNNKTALIGGEPAMWGEWVDPSDLQQTIWPRAAAAAERLWTYPVGQNSSYPGVPQRLAQFRGLLLRRGIAAAPLWEPQARSPPPGPGSYFEQ